MYKRLLFIQLINACPVSFLCAANAPSKSFYTQNPIDAEAVYLTPDQFSLTVKTARPF